MPPSRAIPPLPAPSTRPHRPSTRPTRRVHAHIAFDPFSSIPAACSSSPQLPPRLRARRRGARTPRSGLSGRFAHGNASANCTSASGSHAQSNASDTSGSGSNGARRLASPTTRTQDPQRITQTGNETTEGVIPTHSPIPRMEVSMCVRRAIHHGPFRPRAGCTHWRWPYRCR